MGGCGSRAAHPCVRPPPRADDVAVSQWEGRGKDGLGGKRRKHPEGHVGNAPGVVLKRPAVRDGSRRLPKHRRRDPQWGEFLRPATTLRAGGTRESNPRVPFAPPPALAPTTLLPPPHYSPPKSAPWLAGHGAQLCHHPAPPGRCVLRHGRQKPRLLCVRGVRLFRRAASGFSAGGNCQVWPGGPGDRPQRPHGRQLRTKRAPPARPAGRAARGGGRGVPGQRVSAKPERELRARRD